MKKPLSLLLAILFILSFTACAQNQKNTSSEIASIENSEIPEPTEPISPVINGNLLSDYKIVYEDLDIMNKEACRYVDVANEIKAYFKATYSQNLAMVPHTSFESEKEIILGLVPTREMSKSYSSALGYDKYKVVIKGNKIWIAGSYASGVYQGFKELVEMFNSSKDSVFNDMEFSGQCKVIKVSAVGDSITHGINSYNYTQVYPYYLQKMLGYDYYVLNSGLTSTSIGTIDGNFCYSTTAEYRDAKKFKPDVVLFGFGTNDANPSTDQPYKDWENPENNRVEVFKRDTKALWDSFKEVNPDVQIFVILPPSLIDKPEGAFWNPVVWTENIKKYSHPLLVELAKDYDLTTVDMFPWSQSHPSVFIDGLHPKGEGYRQYAQHIYEGIAKEIKKP